MKKNSIQVVLVDTNDMKIGLMEKLAAHKGKGVLHRAISVLLYRKQEKNTEILLQQRGTKKPLWPLFWSNTICTHPIDGESTMDCAVRRLKEELGIHIDKRKIRYFFKLSYQARYNNLYSEHELDSVFVGEWQGDVHKDIDEVHDTRWIEMQELLKDMKEHPQKYTPWFHLLIKNNRIQELFTGSPRT